MFVKSMVITPTRKLAFVYHKPSNFFNASHFLTQYPEKSLNRWTDNDDTIKIVNRAARVLCIGKNSLFKVHLFNLHDDEDGLYIHPILTNYFLKWTSLNEAHKYVLPRYLEVVNKNNGF